MNRIINSLEVPEKVKSRLRTWWHDCQGHPKGKNLGDVIIPKSWGVDKNGEYHRKPIKDYGKAGAQDASEVKRNIIESFKQNPKGKDPGDVIKIGMHHGSSINEGRATHYKGQRIEGDPRGKNLGDVVRVQPEGHGNDRLGSRGSGLRPWEERFHPHFPFTEITKPSCPECPALVNYDEEEYRYCVELFQDVMTDILSLIYTYIGSYFPDKLQSEEVKEAVTWLQEIEEMEKDIGMPIIYSKELRNFIKTLS